MQKNIFQQIPAPLLSWYRANKRALPWRENPTPYRVWVSEIMLQQTQVDTVIRFFERFMEGEKTLDKSISKRYNPEIAPKFLAVPEIAAEGRMLANHHRTMPYRAQTVSWRLLHLHTEFCERYAEFMYQKAIGNNNVAYEMAYQFFDDFGKHEVEIERYFDHAMFCGSVNLMVKKRPKFIFQM